MPFRGGCDRKYDLVRYSVARRDAIGVVADSPRDIGPRHDDDFSGSSGLPVPLVERDGRTRISHTVVDVTVSTPSTHALP